MITWPDRFWYQKHWLRFLLWPISLIYRGIVKVRRIFLQTFCQKYAEMPVIVVGNVTVGGVGKTPLVIALAKKLKQKGLKVGIVSRGYGGSLHGTPHEVSLKNTASEVGDEPLLIKKKTRCPVMIAADRFAGVSWLQIKHKLDIIISDDGLQHYGMARTLEIAVIDGLRGLGNGLCLPAGPLREPPSRLHEVDFLVVNEGDWPGAYPMQLKPGAICELLTDKPGSDLTGKEGIAAMAAIGNPQRFFNTLHACDIVFQPYVYPDHYQFKLNDFDKPEQIFLMTEKDAVKCKPFATDAMHYLPVEAVLSEQFWEKLLSHERLQGVFQ